VPPQPNSQSDTINELDPKNIYLISSQKQKFLLFSPKQKKKIYQKINNRIKSNNITPYFETPPISFCSKMYFVDFFEYQQKKITKRKTNP